jgi:cytochrome P450
MIWTTGLLALRPDIQDRAYSSILATHPPQTPPDPYTESSPYIVALTKEASRYFNVFRLSLPRCTVKDSQWEGHSIPEGTTVFLNAWACNMDNGLYDHADVFKPERFLEDEEGGVGVNELNGPSTYAFGMGRRACPGVHLAMREMYVTLSSLIYYFRIEPVAGENIDVHPLNAIENARGFSMAPRRFKVRFVPRQENLERLKKALAVAVDE